MASSDTELRARISALVDEYFALRFSPKEFKPGSDPVRYAGRVFDSAEIKAAVNASLDFWLTAGRYSEEFESAFSQFTGIDNVLLASSGSSANLLAFSALTSPVLADKAIQPGDEVITAAAAFPTTVNPILQNRCIPVFVDVDIGTYNVSPNDIERAISKKTKAIFVAHTLGNPYDLCAIGGDGSSEWIMAHRRLL